MFEGVRVMVLNATFNNISAIAWWSVILVEETGVSVMRSPFRSKLSITVYLIYQGFDKATSVG